MQQIKQIMIPLLCILLGCTACYYSPQHDGDQWDLSSHQRDSIDFVQKHHFAENYNFVVLSDSLVLHPLLPTLLSSEGQHGAILRKGDHIVVAQIQILSAIARGEDLTKDSVWVKVAKNQSVMGWIPEKTLLAQVVPDDPIAKFIHFFSSSSVLLFFLILATALVIFLYKGIKQRSWRYFFTKQFTSFYSTLFVLFLSMTAAIYGTFQHFAPDTWLHYYHNPTLNPFGQPLLMSLFLIGVWSQLIGGLAMIDDLRRRFAAYEALTRLMSLAGICVLLYLFFSFSVRFYIGYVALVVLWIVVLRGYFQHNNFPYRCGKCGNKLRALGRCPHCGTINR